MLLNRRTFQWVIQQATALLTQLFARFSIAGLRPNAKDKSLLWVAAGLCCTLLAGCNAPPATPVAANAPVPISTPVSEPDDPTAAAAQLVLWERQGSATGDRTLLEQLWAEDARVVDGRGTAEPTDDYVWAGRIAVLDRYVVAVFPHPPPVLAVAPTFTVTVTGNQASARNSTDRWRFVYQAGRWWLAELIYSRP